MNISQPSEYIYSLLSTKKDQHTFQLHHHSVIGYRHFLTLSTIKLIRKHIFEDIGKQHYVTITSLSSSLLRSITMLRSITNIKPKHIFEDIGKQHYVTITSFSCLLNSQYNKVDKKTHFCRYCLHVFSREERLVEHMSPPGKCIKKKVICA